MIDVVKIQHPRSASRRFSACKAVCCFQRGSIRSNNSAPPSTNLSRSEPPAFIVSTHPSFSAIFVSSLTRCVGAAKLHLGINRPDLDFRTSLCDLICLHKINRQPSKFGRLLQVQKVSDSVDQRYAGRHHLRPNQKSVFGPFTDRTFHVPFLEQPIRLLASIEEILGVIELAPSTSMNPVDAGAAATLCCAPSKRAADEITIRPQRKGMQREMFWGII